MSVNATQEEIEAGRGYEALFVPALFAPWPRHVLDAANVHASAHVLDVACGTGVLARAALARVGKSGKVAGLDPAPGMIAVAREAGPGIDWVQGTAEDMPFEEACFDFVVSQFGLMFFQDFPKAAREMYRVMKPGGALSVAVWHSVDQNPAYKDVASVQESHVSPEAAETVRIPFRLGDPAPVARQFEQAGFEAVGVTTRQEQATFPSTRTMVEVELRGWLPLFGIHLGEDKITEVLEQSDAVLSKYATASGEATFPTSAYVMTARKPV